MQAKIEVILKRYSHGGREQLIPILQEVQAVDGYLSEESVEVISRHLGLPASKIYGVATFYNQFRFVPKGRYHIMVCRGTACHVKGSARVLEAVQDVLKIEDGQTTRDRIFSLEVVACMGACALAPVINVNGEFFAKVTPMKVRRILEDLRKREKADEEAA